ncbi:hypothetical protein PATSB16_04140 [Pandoraea thiooxydans]|uniref:Probable inorganic carbon transporter subunit DabA n=1 Tax=Pandoraea thiooxydans TaxID=445709 RepID=A0A0G3EQF0_9BURK|nr:hypothetical protein PATSB16_04140 [Pandoraea thiooxydans]
MSHSDIDTVTPSQQAAAGALPPLASQNLDAMLDEACQKACAAIAPAWPLDRSIAVNPHWGRTGDAVQTVAARLSLLAGARVYPSRRYFLQAWTNGTISGADLHAARHHVAAAGQALLDEQQCVQALQGEPALSPIPLLIDLLDVDAQRNTHLPWRQAITHQISQTCAAYFDHAQADWQPERGGGLYAFWRDTLEHDPGIGTLMGLPQLHRQLNQLPPTPDLAIRWVMEKVDLPSAVWPDYLEALLLNINGWASWCAYLDWQARQAGGRDHSLRELLAVRLAWGAILLNPALIPGVGTGVRALRELWREAPAKLAAAQSAFAVDEVWQLALDLAYQRRLASQLGAPAAAGAAASGDRGVEAQAVFCIDVRSEPLRRALETHDRHIQTIGFAGFFGLPIAYTPIGTAASSPRLPGLLPPAVQAGDSLRAPGGPGAPSPASVQRARQRHFSIAEQWRAASRWPAAAFSYVEAFGWSYGSALRHWLKIKPHERDRDDLDGLPKRYRHLCRPSLDHLDAAARAEMAARILRLMGLDRDFAPLVLLVGHGSQSANNPQAAALECGACGGQSGEVNARILARMLNDAEVREHLAAHGIRVPAHTVFAAALHNTTTDEVEWFDLDLLPAAGQASIARLRATFAAALDQVRRERAPQLRIDATQQPARLLRTLQRRASDGAQTRPEWGLANNAAFIIAPRELTRGVNLAGRSFLHDYDASHDGDGSKLEQLMTAPMLVTHWINWQYHASSCEPVYFGSGNKLLHNVVGAHIGVFEGNGGDLRIGLSRQSLHDGEREMHEPLRLSVIIAAAQQRIEAVLQKHAHLRALVDNHWLHLCHYDNGILSHYCRGQWLAGHQNDISATASGPRQHAA